MRELHVGRLIDHIHLRARDLPATQRFYRAVLGAHGPAQRSAASVVIRA